MFILFLAMLVSNVVYAGDITGEITVLNKSGKKPLKSFVNAVVYLEGLETSTPAEPAVMNQTKKRFKPRLLAVVKGQEIQFLNSDRVQHNVFSPNEEEPFDLGRYPKGKYESMTLNVLGQHKVYCNIHQKMIADIYVLPNHYFSITDKTGKFTIRDVPPGEYTLKVSHIYGGMAEKSVQVTDDLVEQHFEITSQKKIREITKHKNKYGKKYKIPGRNSDY